MLGDFTGFAVFDLETTGIAASKHHRIIEFGVVRLDENLEVVEEWETLINPERDIGAFDVHGLTAGDVNEAPTFADIAADIWHRFEGTIPVAHNFSFDRRFILAEFARTGVDLDSFDGLCTMQLAGNFGLSGGFRRLCDICWQLSIPLQDCHSAGNDARMCAEVLRRIAVKADLPSLARPVSCPTLWKRPASPLGITRQKAREIPIESVLQKAASRLSSIATLGQSGHGKLEEYLSVLDRVLEDRVVDPEEVDELVAFAQECGLSREIVQELHGRYLSNLASIVLSDGIVTDDERRDINRVAGLLGITPSTVDRLLTETTVFTGPQTEDLSGKSVCFTGELRSVIDGEHISRGKAEALAEAMGLHAAPRVTKKLDILVVADPDSSSGKARKARQYGVRIIAERSFWTKLGIDVQ